MEENEIQFQPITEDELESFWQLRDTYMREDIIPNSDPPLPDEDAEWFFGPEYRNEITACFTREHDRLKIAYLLTEGEYAGFIMYILYDNTEGKYFGECFIMEYCIEASHRGRGLGSRFFKRFEQDMRQQGAAYFALNTTNERNRKFWVSHGFEKGQEDEYGNPVYFKRKMRLTI
jgi:GNAT superfamily N-acetyltransferase